MGMMAHNILVDTFYNMGDFRIRRDTKQLEHDLETNKNPVLSYEIEQDFPAKLFFISTYSSKSQCPRL